MLLVKNRKGRRFCGNRPRRSPPFVKVVVKEASRQRHPSFRIVIINPTTSTMMMMMMNMVVVMRMMKMMGMV